MSRRAAILNTWLRLVERPALARLNVEDLARVRRRFEWQARMLFPLPRGQAWRWTDRAEMPVFEIGPTDGARLLYLHGGGYVFGSPRTHKGLAGRLAARTGIGAVVPDYPMAPEHPFPAAPAAVLRLYRQMVTEAPVILAGDSAGGGLALSLLAQICADPTLPQPLATLVLSPWTDLSLSGRSFATNDQTEMLLPAGGITESRDVYLAGADPADPLASPLFADFAGAAPVRIWVGDGEMLLDDSRRMASRLTAQGIDTSLTVEHNLPHVWPLFPGWLLPEAERTLDQMGAEIRAALPLGQDAD